METIIPFWLPGEDHQNLPGGQGGVSQDKIPLRIIKLERLPEGTTEDPEPQRLKPGLKGGGGLFLATGADKSR